LAPFDWGEGERSDISLARSARIVVGGRGYPPELWGRAISANGLCRFRHRAFALSHAALNERGPCALPET